MWLGAKDLEGDGFFTWENSKRKLRSTFRNWDSSLKHSSLQNRKELGCLMMWKDNGKWTNDYCNAKTTDQVTMCEILNVKPGSGIAKTTAATSTPRATKPGEPELITSS